MAGALCLSAGARPERYLQRHTVREADQAGKELPNLLSIVRVVPPWAVDQFPERQHPPEVTGRLRAA